MLHHQLRYATCPISNLLHSTWLDTAEGSWIRYDSNGIINTCILIAGECIPEEYPYSFNTVHAGSCLPSLALRKGRSTVSSSCDIMQLSSAYVLYKEGSVYDVMFMSPRVCLPSLINSEPSDGVSWNSVWLKCHFKQSTLSYCVKSPLHRSLN
jgi:hypothetical protein